MSIDTVSPERKRSLRQLVKLMNQRHAMPFPISKPLLDCFELVVTPEEADFLLRMGLESKTYEQAASLSDLSEETFRPFFTTLLKKGLVAPQLSASSEELFLVNGIMVGWFEMQLADGQETPEKKEFARRVEALFQSWRKMNFFPLRNYVNYKFRKVSKPHHSIAAIDQPEKNGGKRHIAVDHVVAVPETKVYPTKTISELIQKYGDENRIAVVHCFCRQWRKMLHEPCRFDIPSESCVVIGAASKYAVDYGIGRYIDKEEALKIMDEIQKKGAIHQVFHEDEDIHRPEIAICNCCWDCCGVLASYNKAVFPLHVKSYYAAQIADKSLCTGCGKCEKYCPVHAITLEDKMSVIDANKCIGCGQCAFQCPEGALKLEFKERSVVLPLQKKTRLRAAH